MGLFDGIGGLAEVAATIGSGAIAEPIAGLGGLFTGNPALIEQLKHGLTYQPKSQLGMQNMQSIADFLKSAKSTMVDNNPPVNMAVDAYNSASDYMGSKSPIIGAAMKTLPDAIMLLGTSGGSGLARGAIKSTGRAINSVGDGAIAATEAALRNASASPGIRGPMAFQKGSIGVEYEQPTLFHGTSGNHTELNTNYAGSVSSGDGRGIWFTKSRPYAWEYAENAAGKRGGSPRIIEGKSNLENPLIVDFDDKGRPIINGKTMDFSSNSEVIDHAIKNKHDGIDWINGSFTDDPSVTFFRPGGIKITDQGL